MKSAIVLTLCLAPYVLAQQIFNNDSILRMMTMVFSEDAIIESINRNPGRYDTSLDALIALKNGGVTSKMIDAMVHKDALPATIIGAPLASPSVTHAVAAPVAHRMALSATAAESTRPTSSTKPRVLIVGAASHGTNWSAERNQSIEMSRDFQNVCPGVQVSLNRESADYTVQLNHIEVGLMIRDNQIQIANRNGDLISATQGGSIKGRVKQACNAIEADWNRERAR